jgi:hypothetical protein
MHLIDVSANGYLSTDRTCEADIDDIVEFSLISAHCLLSFSFWDIRAGRVNCRDTLWQISPTRVSATMAPTMSA